VKAAFDTLVGREVLIEGYGLTEASPLTHANPIRRAKAGSIGIPLADTDARIVDLDTGADVAPGAPGELLVRGPQVMRGYWQRPEETARVLADGWLRTGDVAVMDGEGYFRIVDRQKDVINTAGFKVWPREVEEALYAHPAVRGAAVISVPDAYRGEAVRPMSSWTRPPWARHRPGADRLLPGALDSLQGAARRRVPGGAPPDGDGEAPPASASRRGECLSVRRRADVWLTILFGVIRVVMRRRRAWSRPDVMG
jgi:hypothetical protein